MIYSPVSIKVAPSGKPIIGVLLDQDVLVRVIGIIEENNENGLKPEDAALLLRLKNAAVDLFVERAKEDGKYPEPMNL